MRVCADIATNEYYYHDFNSGWIGKDDMLTQALGAKGYELKFGMNNSYDYVCPGYKQDDKAPTPPAWDATQPIDNNAKAFGDLRLYEGFLKCLYMEGMIGGVAGYFSYPKGGFDAVFPPDKPPQYLMQMVILARVHALFSHQEAFLRQGVRGSLHHCGLSARRDQFSKIGEEVQGFRRGVQGAEDSPPKAMFDGAEESDGNFGGVENTLQEESSGGLAVCARDADEL
jgi:hypothetical protein